jgi:predicted ATP-grasp superfamily ATP-dependent carboligase
MSASDRLRVLITDGNSRAALAATRSLGQHGHYVVVGDASPAPLARASRFSADGLVYPDPAVDEAGFLRAVRDAVRRHQIDVLVPIADIAMMVITEARHEFEPGCRVPFPDAARVARAGDKAAVVRLAETLSIPIPRTLILETAGSLASVEGLAFPIVVKPHRSRLRTPGGWRSSTAVRYARTREELEHELATRPEAEFPLLLQEKIVGPGMGVFACCRQGVPVAFFSHRRLREKPPSGGVSVLCESIDLRPDARRFSERLLGAFDWEGVAMVEFKVDERDGVPRLMEVNGRFWGSLQLAIDAGVDFPDLLIRSVVLGEHVEPPTYRVGVRSRWFWGDVDALVMRLRSPASKGSRLRAVADFCHFLGPELHYENPRWSDLRPGLVETSRWLRGH